MRPRPPCPRCTSSDVINLGGGTHGKYRYSSNDCELNGVLTHWQQIPPHRLQDGQSAQIKMSSGVSKRYRCKTCGLYKRGHVCGVSEQPVDYVATYDTVDPAPDVLPLPLPLAPVSLAAPFQSSTQ